MRSASPALVISVIALFVALGGAGMAATGGYFILGKANTAGATSYLTAPVAGGNALNISNLNTTTGSSALRLNVASGHAPFLVNSTTRVSGLNADRLDGRSSTAFLPSSGTIQYWYSPLDYVADRADTVTLGKTLGPETVATSPAPGGEPVYLSLDQPQSILGTPLKVKAVTVCYSASAPASISYTALTYGDKGQDNTLASDASFHSSASPTCYALSAPTATMIAGSLALDLTLYFPTGAGIVYLYGVRLTVGT
jgi:hypothetical protein